MATPWDTIGRYELLSELGRGAMGTVYRARDGEQDVAIKVLHPHLIDDSDEYLARFRREADIGLRVRHANVVETVAVDTFTHDGATYHYLVLEYVEGHDLRALMNELGTVPEELCWHIGCEIEKGLRAIHDAGAVHRDVKPENILITPDHQVKLMDLGIASLVDLGVSQGLTVGFVGTATYAAPEQFLGEPLDGRTDWYALGLVLFELATGRRAAKADTAVELMHERLEVNPPRAGELNPQLSPFFEEVVSGLLLRDRDQRLDLLPQEDSDWWRDRTEALRVETHQPLRRIRIPRETALQGREEELTLLGDLFDRASAGAGQVLLLEGEAGVGKSRLVDEFVQGLDGDVHFLFGANPLGGAATASGAFVEAFREHLGGYTSAGHLSEAPALVPAFDALLRGDVAPSEHAKLTKEALQSAFVHVSRALGRERPTVVLIEDLHLAPEDGLALFAALGQAIASDRVLLIGTTRPGLDPAWVGPLSKVEQVSRMVLQRLGPKEVGALLLAALGSKRLAEELAFQVLTKSDGNPFFVFEILRSLRDERFLTLNDSGTWTKTKDIDEITIPSSVLDLIEARVADLDDDERGLLDVAACCGFEFDPLLVAEALALNRTPALKMLARLERRNRLVRATGRRFVFDHHQVQEALYDRVPELLREDYHACLAEALERRAGPNPEGDTRVLLAEHFLRGGRTDGARRHLEQALEHLSGQYEFERIGLIAEQALGVPGLLEDAARFRVLMRAVAALDATGRQEERRAALEEARTIAEALDDAARLAEVSLSLSSLTATAGRLEDALAVAREAEEYAVRAENPILVAQTHASAGSVLRQMGRTDEAVLEYEAMRSVLEGVDAPSLSAQVTLELGRCRVFQGEVGAAKAGIERAIDLFRELGERHREVVAWSVLGNAAWLQGDYEEAMRCNEQTIEILRSTGHRTHLGQALGNIALVHLAQGHLGAAKHALEEQQVLSAECGNVRGVGVALLNLGSVLNYLGDPEAARATLERAVSTLRGIGASFPLGHALRFLSTVERQEGRLAEAQRLAQEALELRMTLPDRAAVAEAHLSIGALCAEQGDRQGAARHLDAAMDIGRELENQGLLLQCHIEGAIHLDRDAAPALALWSDGLGEQAVTAQMELRYALWRLSRDASHLAAAREALAHLREHAPDAYRDTMLESVSLYGRIQRGE